MGDTATAALALADGVVRHDWDGEAVVYVEASGDTHLYDPALTLVLDALPGAGGDLVGWAARARTALGAPQGFETWFPAAVARLRRDGVVVEQAGLDRTAEGGA